MAANWQMGGEDHAEQLWPLTRLVQKKAGAGHPAPAFRFSRRMDQVALPPGGAALSLSLAGTIGGDLPLSFSKALSLSLTGGVGAGVWLGLTAGNSTSVFSSRSA